jgi:hypothetical protein
VKCNSSSASNLHRGHNLFSKSIFLCLLFSIIRIILLIKGNKLRTYKDLKKKFEMENFLKLDIDRSDISIFVRLRISNIILMIEKSRHRKSVYVTFDFILHNILSGGLFLI